MALRQFHHLSSKLLGNHPAQCNCQNLFLSSMNRAMTCQPATGSVAVRALTTVAADGVRKRKKQTPAMPPLAVPVDVLSRSFHNTSLLQNDDKKNQDSTTSSSSAATTAPNMGMKDKFKHLWKKYGVLAVGTYFGIYFGTLGGMFLALDYNLFTSSTFGLDPAYAIDKFCHIYERFTGDNTLPSYIRDHPAVGTFGIAYIMTKFTEPLRLAVTIGIVPKIASILGRRQQEEENEQQK